MNKNELNQQISIADSLVAAFNNDGAIVLLDSLQQVLLENQMTESYLWAKVLYKKAEALEKDERNDDAIVLLYDITTQTQKLGFWDIHVAAHLSLARLYEKLGRSESCLVSLKKAQSICKTHSLDSLYTRFAVRMSSYKRIFENGDSAWYYANKAVEMGEKNNAFSATGDGYLLKGLILSRNGNKNDAIINYKNAAEIFKKLNDYRGVSYMYNNISSAYIFLGKYKSALAYSDLAVHFSKIAFKNGNSDALASIYRDRSDIFKNLKQYDSLLYYVKLAQKEDLAYFTKKEKEKILELEATFKSREKEEQIKTQLIQLRTAKERRYFLIGIIILVSILTFLLTFAYFSLRQSKKKVESQAKLIQQTNQKLSESLEKQIVLQGEAHHRVKNNLQIIISLLELHVEETENPELIDNYTAMSNRIFSMASIHELLYSQEGDLSINIEKYTENLCSHFASLLHRDSQPLFNIKMNSYLFNIETSMPIGIIITELLSNSFKYAVSETQNLQINIDLQQFGDSFMLVYRDNGLGFKNGKLEEREGGLGTYLVLSMVRQLNGKLQTKNDGGACFNIFFKEKNN